MRKMPLAAFLLIMGSLILSDQCLSADRSWQASLEPAVIKGGLTIAEFSDITTYYYKNPDPDKLLSVLKIVLSLDGLIADTQQFGPIAHLMATVAHHDSVFLEKIRSLAPSYSGPRRKALEAIIREAADFSSPSIPGSAKDLDYLWSEFIATGDTAPVKEIIGVLGYPPHGENLILIGAAEWSLTANARQHQIVNSLLKQELLFAKGQTKEKIVRILNALNMPKADQSAEDDIMIAGTEQAQGGKNDEAIGSFSRVIAMNPGRANAYYNRGLSYGIKGDLDKAIADLTKALEIVPNSAPAYSNRGYAYDKKGDAASAIADYNKAIEVDPDFVQAYRNRGILLIKNGEFDKGIADMNRLITANPGYTEGYWHRAFAYYKINNYDASWLDVHKAESLGFKVPSDFITYLKKASGRER